MIISRGGKEYQPSTESIAPPKQKDMSYAAFVLWETMIGLQVERQQAAQKWERIEALYEKVDANPDHPNIGKVHARINTLEKEILAHQREFLEYEKIAHREWDRMSSLVRAEQQVTGMYHTLDDMPLPPLWKHPLGESSKPALFPMSPTALQFASPALIRIYQKKRR